MSLPRPYPVPRMRTALLAAFASAALAALPACIPPVEPGIVVPPNPAPAITGDTLRQPRDVYSRNGVLNVTLAVGWANLKVPVQRDSSVTWRLRAYSVWEVDGRPLADSTPAFPGPTLHVRPGDRVLLKLVNNLPTAGNDTVAGNVVCQKYGGTTGNPPVDTFPDCFHGPNWTNIHYHGFHVTPDSLGDDVLLQIQPGRTFQYDFRIPHNQSPGTHWYHPHKHGSVAIQVLNGMSGAFLVHGGALDSLTDSLGMRDRLIGIQQIDTTVNLIAFNKVTPNLVNGQYRPTIVMRPNEVQRWRLVNEDVKPNKNAVIGFVDVDDVNEPQVFDVARDGVQFAPSNYSTSRPDGELLVSPGNRLDVFVKAPPTPGLHLFHLRPVGAERPGSNRQPGSRAGGGTGGGRGGGPKLGAAQAAPPDTIFYVQVVDDGKTVNTTLPATLPALPGFLADLTPANDTVYVVFTDSTPGAPTRFYLGSEATPYQRFNPDTVFIPSDSAGAALPMLLNTTQTWKVINRSSQQINHPFHIHINPFQVNQAFAPSAADQYQPLYAQLNAAAAPGGSPIWLDVVPLPAPTVDSNGYIVTEGYIVLTQRYTDFTGEYVMHCHILGHEERGMMQTLKVYPDLLRARQEGASSRAGSRGHRH